MAIVTVSQFDIAKFRTLIQEVLNLPNGTVIPAYQPSTNVEAFITVHLIHQQQRGTGFSTYDGEYECIRMNMLSVFSVSCFGKNAVATALKLKGALQTSQARQALLAIGGTIENIGEVKNLSTSLGAVSEERGQIDIFITHKHKIKTALPPIENVDILVNEKRKVIVRKGEKQ